MVENEIFTGRSKSNFNVLVKWVRMICYNLMFPFDGIEISGFENLKCDFEPRGIGLVTGSKRVKCSPYDRNKSLIKISCCFCPGKKL